MKRTYTKPELFYEEYELTEAIAGNCGNKLYLDKVNSGSYLSCTVDMGGGDFLFMSPPSCNTDPADIGGICYEAYAENEMLFNS